MSTNTTEQGCR